MCILDCLLVSATIFYMNKAKIWMGVVTSLQCRTTVQGQKVKATTSRDISADKNAITWQRIVISTSNLVGIIDVRVDACGILSRSVGQTNWEVEIWRKFINNRFCACPVQMLLKMAVNETVCSTFEVQYGKSTSTRTTAIRHLGHLQHITWFRACAESHASFITGPWIIFADKFNYFHRRATEVA